MSDKAHEQWATATTIMVLAICLAAAIIYYNHTTKCETAIKYGYEQVMEQNQLIWKKVK